MDRPRLIRGLRIAMSAVCGLLCVLLLVLWVRSHSWIDLVYVEYHPRITQVDALYVKYHAGGVVRFVSARGELRCEMVLSSGQRQLTWETGSRRAPGWEFSTWRLPANRDPDLNQKNVLGFRWLQPGYARIPVVPHWFAALLIGGLGIVLASNYSFRFSLRTLLIATTLFAVVMGFIVWAIRS